MTTSKSIDLSLETAVLGFEIGGTQPVGSLRKFIFKVDDKFYYFQGDELKEFLYPATVENILRFGSTWDNLQNINGVPSLICKKIYPIIALAWNDEAVVEPTASVAIKASSSNDIYQKFFYLPIFENEDGWQLKNFDLNYSLIGNANISPQIRCLNGSTWDDWGSLSDAENKKVDAFQLRFKATVTTLDGTDAVNFRSMTANVADNKRTLATENFVLTTAPIEADDDLKTAYLLVKHNWLAEKNLRAFVDFSGAREDKIISAGTATGESQNFTIPDADFDFQTLELYADDENIPDFTFDGATNEITFTAPENSQVTLKYKCGISAENWLEMENQFTIYDENFSQNCWVSRFAYWLEGSVNSSVVKIKIVADSGIEIYSFACGFSYD